MPATKLPSPVMGMDTEALTDLMFRYYRELEYLLNGQLDSQNIRSITTDELIAGTAKISTALIEDLVVGGNVSMGPSATISWANVTGQPTIPTQYTDAQALAAWVASGYKTYINSSGIYTGTLTANQVNVGSLVAEKVVSPFDVKAYMKVGSATGRTQLALYDENNSTAPFMYIHNYWSPGGDFWSGFALSDRAEIPRIAISPSTVTLSDGSGQTRVGVDNTVTVLTSPNASKLFTVSNAGYSLTVAADGFLSKIEGLDTSSKTVSITTNSRVLVAADAGKRLWYNHNINGVSANITLTIPTQANCAFPVDTEIEVYRYDATYTVTIAAQSGVYILCPSAGRTILDDMTSIFLKKVDATTWTLQGNV